MGQESSTDPIDLTDYRPHVVTMRLFPNARIGREAAFIDRIIAACENEFCPLPRTIERIMLRRS